MGDGELVLIVLGLLFGHRDAFCSLDDRVGLNVADLQPESLIETVDRKAFAHFALTVFELLLGRDHEIAAVHVARHLPQGLDRIFGEGVGEIHAPGTFLIRPDFGEGEGLFLVVLHLCFDTHVLAEAIDVEINRFLTVVPGHIGDVFLAENDLLVVLDLEDYLVPEDAGRSREGEDDGPARRDVVRLRFRDPDAGAAVFAGHADG